MNFEKLEGAQHESKFELDYPLILDCCIHGFGYWAVNPVTDLLRNPCRWFIGKYTKSFLNFKLKRESYVECSPTFYNYFSINWLTGRTNSHVTIFFILQGSA